MVAATQEREKRLGLHLPVDVTGEGMGGSAFQVSGRTLNISGGGICFEGRVPVPVGSRLTLNIQLPVGLRRHFHGRSVYRARAVVCRAERVNGGDLSRIGARFLQEI